MKKKHTILIVPPRGISLKSFKIRLSVAIVLLLVVLIGFTGFFVPIKTVTNNVAEQNQKKNLTEQNRSLLHKVITSLRMLQDVRNQIGRLETKKLDVIKVSGSNEAQKDRDTKSIDFNQIKSSELLEYTKKIEARFEPFSKLTADSGNIFDTIPVLRPIPEPALISRRYGMAFDPFSGNHRSHYGTDFIAESGTPVMATASGVVRRIEKHPLWGNKITIEHGGIFATVYAHVGVVKVSQGKQVRRGDIIGEMGLSGLTSGPHVHYEVWRDGASVDPEEYLFPVDLIARKE